LRVAFKIKNSIGKIPAARNIRHKNTDKETGIYQLVQIARKRYTGQTGRTILYTSKWTFQSSRTFNTNSKFFQHLLENKHIWFCWWNYVLHVLKKGSHVNTSEKCYIHSETKHGNSTVGTNQLIIIVLSTT